MLTPITMSIIDHITKKLPIALIKTDDTFFDRLKRSCLLKDYAFGLKWIGFMVIAKIYEHCLNYGKSKRQIHTCNDFNK